MNKPDRLYTIKEAMPLLGVGLTKIYAMANEDKIQMIKNGKRTFIAESEIVRFRASLPTIGNPSRAA